MKMYSCVAERLPQFEQMKKALEEKQTPVLTVGLSDIHKTHFIYAQSCISDEPILVVVEDEAKAKRMCDDINMMHSVSNSEIEQYAMLFPSRDFTFRQVETSSKEYEQIRIGVLSNILNKTCRICFCSIDALSQRTIPPEKLLENTIKISANTSVNIETLSKQLISAGYVRRPQIEGIAQFSVRGGIVDVFPPSYTEPVRMEFWGDDIDSIANFEIESQRRTDPVDSVLITPACECLFESNEVLTEKITALKKSISRKTKVNDLVIKKLDHDIDRLNSEVELLSIDKYIPLAYDRITTLLNYFDRDKSLLFVNELSGIKERGKASAWQMEEDIKILLEEGELCQGLNEYTLSMNLLIPTLATYNSVYMDTFAHGHSEVPYKNIISISPLQTSNFSGELKILREDLQPLMESRYCVCILAGNQKSALNLAHDLEGMGFKAQYSKDITSLSYGQIYVLDGTISAGFEYPEIKFSLISTNKTTVTTTKKSRYAKGKTIRSLDDLEQGDYVVHATHGIGIFDGIHQIEFQNILKDYIKIKYAGTDILYVPVTQLDLVSKYIGPKDDGKMKLNKLNSAEWQKTKARVKKSCEDMADQLIELYSKRMEVKGFAFEKDTIWQREFEDHFEYQETSDQLRSIDELKRDMEKPHPMDRLLCGDVGFGKTEVALRGAFKCVMSSKQCAILCPTTILAWQHYQNALKRFENYPINIELMSRFRTPKQIRETIKKLKMGEVDILIGTHRIIQKDVVFHDLGLAIIDEEQRFGVKHKEKFKEMFANVDMLNLSATPIPRTLNMAMSGIRDMSTIEQAPQDRRPVQTYVLEFDMGIVADAIRKELRRNGQVYYIHNRVDTIDMCATKIQQAVPDARIGIAHGKMSEQELSEIWRQLMEQEIDVLVCTTLIETGVDVKNCNTLIIENADNLGLSQLYQLRGRVGRSNRRAFAYLTFERGKVLTEIATKRLTAIREFTTFGSGFRIALRDLEIRGAGSILGGSQHGHMESVGYDMYVRLLTEAMAKRKGEKPPIQSYECLIDIQINAHIPEKYIENLSQRIDIYKKIACVKNSADKIDLLDELFDRFGDIPKSVEALVDVGMLRNILASHGFKEIRQRVKAVTLIPEKMSLQTSVILAREIKNRVVINTSSSPNLTVKFAPNGNVLDTLKEIAEVLENKVDTLTE